MGVTEARGKAGEASAPRTRYSSSSFSCCSCRLSCDSFSRASWASSRSSESCLWVQTEARVAPQGLQRRQRPTRSSRTSSIDGSPLVPGSPPPHQAPSHARGDLIC